MLDLGPEVQGGDGPVADACVALVRAAREVVLVDQGQGVNGELPDRIGKVRGLLQPVLPVKAAVSG